MFSHYANRNSSAAYALRQDSNGTTTINSKSGYKILFGVNNQYKMTVSGDAVGIGYNSWLRYQLLRKNY